MQHNKIYTKRGDTGLSSTIGTTDISKDSLVFNVIGNIDELNAILGIVKSSIQDSEQIYKITSIQKNIFLASSEIVNQKNIRDIGKLLGIDEVNILEKDIDKWEEELPELKNFIIPGENSISSQIHLARAICRRTERSIVSFNKKCVLRPELLIFFNRLSDWLFVLARKNSPNKETIWTV